MADHEGEVYHILPSKICDLKRIAIARWTDKGGRERLCLVAVGSAFCSGCAIGADHLSIFSVLP